MRRCVPLDSPSRYPAKTLVRMHTRAATLIEVLVALGVLTVLLSLLLPVVQSAREQARRIRLVSGARQASISVSAYCAQYDGVYPFSTGTTPVANAFMWHEPMRKAGLLDSSDRLIGTFQLAATFSANPFSMMRGRTVPPSVSPAMPISDARVRFPSNKGLLFTARDATGTFWCCDTTFSLIAPELPVCFVDGTAVLARWHDLLPAGRLIVEDDIGYPVDRTWDGCMGRDRP
jgi:hypothetical protein